MSTATEFQAPRAKEAQAAQVRAVSRVDRLGERTALAFETPTGIVRLELTREQALWLAGAITANDRMDRAQREGYTGCQSSI